jgi:hypothetical protein
MVMVVAALLETRLLARHQVDPVAKHRNLGNSNSQRVLSMTTVSGELTGDS